MIMEDKYDFCGLFWKPNVILKISFRVEIEKDLKCNVKKNIMDIVNVDSSKHGKRE